MQRRHLPNTDASASIQNKAKKASENSSFQAQLKGDTFEIAPEDPSNLESWSKALLTNFNSKCRANKDSTQVQQIQIRSWASIFPDIAGDANLNSGDIAILQKATLLKKVTYEGYQRMASYYQNHRRGQPGQKQWTESLGHTCEESRDGPYVSSWEVEARRLKISCKQVQQSISKDGHRITQLSTEKHLLNQW